jgi:GH35 family endo-1,4-beta-xylanase
MVQRIEPPVVLAKPPLRAAELLSRESPTRLPRPSWPMVIVICFLLAVLQIWIGGYSFGVGNQTIQVPLLEHAMDGELFHRDVMVDATGPAYPSVFFRLLAPAARALGIEQLYQLLQLLTAFGVFLAVYAAGIAMFGAEDGASAGLIAALVLLAGHLHALAGETLYSPGFTHTFAVLPLAIAAMALAYRGRFALALLLAGCIFNFHALTAGYLLVMLSAAWIAAMWGRRPTLAQALAFAMALTLFVAAASPTIGMMLAHRQAFSDPQWLALTRVRSGDHSFPSTWWLAGETDLPRFALVAGLFAVALGYRSAAVRQRRQTIGMVISVGLLFVIGYVFSEVWPKPIVLRAQLFRASRLVMVVFVLEIARAGAVATAQLWQRSTWRAWLEFISAVLTVTTLALPAMLPLLPLAFAASVVVASINGRLSTIGATFVGLVAFLCVAAWSDLGFPLIAVPSAIGSGIVLAVVGAGVFLSARVAGTGQRPAPRWGVSGATGIGVVVAILLAYHALQASTTDPWVKTQQWARQNTQTDSLFLTPIQPGGFRLRSQRAIVGEWRDGTQLYFSSVFAPAWWRRMCDLQPGLLTDASGKLILSRGRSLASLDDQALVALAQKYGATHIVLPVVAGAKRSLPVAYSNEGYAVYLPKIPEPEAPKDAPDKERWQADDAFMRDTVLPNIEKNRKSNVRLQLLAAAGKPLAGATVQVHQTNSAFKFSASLPFFEPVDTRASMGDFKPPPVEKPELDRFLEIFNYSMIPFSGKWMYVEPLEGQRNYHELDKYIDFCTSHGIGIEYHFISGYPPAWLLGKTPQQRQDLFLRHARQLAERYGSRIDAWQVVNESVMLEESPAVFKELRKILPPTAMLGISDCAKFASESRVAVTADTRERDMFRGLEAIRWLKSQGIKVDFFGFHGHRPFGLWPEADAMYECFDRFAAEGVRINVTEATVPEDAAILGGLRTGRFTPEVQAEYFARFLTVCYSHPAVDMVNLWGIGPNTWQSGSGLLDRNYNPKPAFDALKKLVTETWRTNTSVTLGLDGSGTFRGFQGDYELTVTLGDGTTKTAKFAVVPGDAQNVVRMQVNSDGMFAPARRSQ